MSLVHFYYGNWFYAVATGHDLHWLTVQRVFFFHLTQSKEDVFSSWLYLEDTFISDGFLWQYFKYNVHQLNSLTSIFFKKG